VRASFLLLGRTNAPYTAGDSLAKPAAVKIAKIMHNDAVANKLAMVSLSNNTGHPRILCQYSATNYCCYQAMSRIPFRHLGNDAQVMVFMQYRATKDYFAFHLPTFHRRRNVQASKIPFKEHQLSWTDYVSVCADGAPPMMRIKMVL